jgi:hypothetical protein
MPASPAITPLTRVSDNDVFEQILRSGEGWGVGLSSARAEGLVVARAEGLVVVVDD